MEVPGMKIEGMEPEDHYFELEDFSIYDAKVFRNLDATPLARPERKKLKAITL